MARFFMAGTNLFGGTAIILIGANILRNHLTGA